MEGAATTVYAQGGRGNSRLVAWEGERTITFTMEDALISPAGFMILSGAGLIEATGKDTIKVHTTEQTDKVTVATDKASGKVTDVTIVLSQKPYVGKMKKNEETDEMELVGTHEDLIYVMRLENGEVATEPYIPDHNSVAAVKWDEENGVYVQAGEGDSIDGYSISLILNEENASTVRPTRGEDFDELDVFAEGDIVLVDYYVEKDRDAQQIEITPDKFGGNYYLEASTLFRDTNGVDMPAEFIIPNCKIQSNFTFTMASSGDPSTFTFTMDAFPDYTRFDKTKKVLAAIQIVNTGNADTVSARTRTSHEPAHEKYFM